VGTGNSLAVSLIVLGAGRQAVETAGYAAEAGLGIAAFLAESAPNHDDARDCGSQAHTFDALADPLLLERLSGAPAICAVGDPTVRARLARRWLELGGDRQFASLVSAHAWLAADVTLGVGVTVAPGAYLNRFARVGDHTLINVGAIISHDVVLGDFVTVSPGSTVGGAVEVGDSTFLGIGCTVRDHVRIGRGAMVGAGAVVVSDVADGVTVMGVPARPRAAR
jgi:sugar O-acyltransferase (sialic acid O-acetyltransferase NeuD family)